MYWRETNNTKDHAPSLRSPLVDKKRISSGRWLGLVFYVSFSDLTLMVGWMERYLGHQKTCSRK